MVLLPLGSLTEDFLFCKSLNNCRVPKQDRSRLSLELKNASLWAIIR